MAAATIQTKGSNAQRGTKAEDGGSCVTVLIFTCTQN